MPIKLVSVNVCSQIGAQKVPLKDGIPCRTRVRK